LVFFSSFGGFGEARKTINTTNKGKEKGRAGKEE